MRWGVYEVGSVWGGECMRWGGEVGSVWGVWGVYEVGSV